MGTRTLLDRLDAALASGAAKFWPELLNALALAGQCAGGVRCFPPDRTGADERPVGLGRCFPPPGEPATSLDLPAGMTTRPTVGPGRASDVAAANGARVLSAEETARILPDAQDPAPKGAGRHCPCSLSPGREGAAGDMPNGEPVQP